MCRVSRIAVLALSMVGVGIAAAAQDSFEIQVYPSALVPRRATMVELHSNFTADGTSTTSDGTQPSDHALHETVEITHGFNEWFEVGMYEFTSARSGDGWQWVGMHVRPRFSVPARYKWPVGLSLSQEIGYQRRDFTVDPWTWEVRAIVDQQVGGFYWSVNLAFEKALSGDHVHDGWGLAPAAKVSVAVTTKIDAGLEYYADVGTTEHLDPWKTQGQQLYPSVDLDLGPRWEFNAGVGFGLTPATDPLVVKVILGYRFGS